jgi:hypothetical protein
VYEERLRWPVWIWLGIAAICVLPVVIILLAVRTAAPSTAGHGPLLSALVFDALVVACLATCFGTLRITLDETALTVGFGPFRERISRDQIVGCRVTVYRWTEWGGWGIRFQRHAKMYNVAGDGGVAVEITLDGGRRVLFSSRHPEAVCAALHAARPGIRA